MKIKKIIEYSITAILTAALVWVLASFIEVNCKNLKPNPQYCPANFFVIMTEISD